MVYGLVSFSMFSIFAICYLPFLSFSFYCFFFKGIKCQDMLGQDERVREKSGSGCIGFGKAGHSVSLSGFAMKVGTFRGRFPSTPITHLAFL